MTAGPDTIRRLVQDLKTQLKDLRRLEVYRRNGIEAFSDLETVKELDLAGYLSPGLVETISEMKRQPGARITDPSFTRAVETAESQETFDFAGSRTLPLFQPLHNRQECYDCHGDDHKVRVFVSVSVLTISMPSCARRATAKPEWRR